MKSNILIIDDDWAVAKLLSTFLNGQGFRTLHAYDADEGIGILRRDAPILVLLDINLPGINGLQALELIKKDQNTKNIPVIMLTSHAEDALKVAGLKGGADDYIVKPFSLVELGARIESLLRRVHRNGDVSNVLSSTNIAIDVDRRQVIADGRNINLTALELELLVRLMKGQGRIMTYRMLADESLHESREFTSGALYQLVKNIRRKLGDRGDAIETVYGVGYRFACQQ